MIYVSNGRFFGVGFPNSGLCPLVTNGFGFGADGPVFHSGQLSTRRAVSSTSFQYSSPVFTCNSRVFNIRAIFVLSNNNQSICGSLNFSRSRYEVGTWALSVESVRRSVPLFNPV